MEFVKHPVEKHWEMSKKSPFRSSVQSLEPAPAEN